MKNIFLIVFCSLFYSSINSQEIQFSVITGTGISWMHANQNVIRSGTAKINFKLHLQGEYWLSERYGLTAGLGFSLGNGGEMDFLKGGDLLKSAKLSDPVYHDLPANTQISYSLNYLDFPFSLKLRTKEFNRWRFYVQIPEFSLSILTRARASIEAPLLPYTKEEDLRDAFCFLNLFYGVGLGFEKNFAEHFGLTGGFRFYQSINDLTSDSGVYSDGNKENSKGILSSIDFRIGVVF